MNDLTGKSALITGASGGIGSEIARAFAEAGADVVVHYHSDGAAAESLADTLRATGRRAVTVQADLADPASAAPLFDQAIEAFGAVDILVNNAGRSSQVSLDAYDDDAVEAMLAVNFKAPFRLMAQAYHRLADGGRILNIGSSLSESPFPGAGAYAASKAGLKTLTEVGAQALGARQITVNTIQPGVTIPGMSSEAPAFITDRAVDSSPLSRLGHPRDTAAVAVFLASDGGQWLTGQHLLVNSGATI